MIQRNGRIVRPRDRRLHPGYYIAILAVAGMALVAKIADGRWHTFAFCVGAALLSAAAVSVVLAFERRRVAAYAGKNHRVAISNGKDLDRIISALWSMQERLDEQPTMPLQGMRGLAEAVEQLSTRFAQVDDLVSATQAVLRAADKARRDSDAMVQKQIAALNVTLSRVLERASRGTGPGAPRQQRNRRFRRSGTRTTAGSAPENVVAMPNSKALELGRQIERKYWERRISGQQN